MFLTVKGFTNQQSFKLVEYNGKWYWDNNLYEYPEEDYEKRNSHPTKEDAIQFAKDWAMKSSDVIKWVQLDGVTIKEEK